MLIAAVLSACTLAYRFVWNVGSAWSDAPDTADYKHLGEAIISGTNSDVNRFTPGYPLFLYFVGYDHVIVAQYVLHAAAVVAIYLIGAQILNSRVIGTLGAFLTAILPTVIFYSNLRLSETLFACLLAFACYFGMSRRIWPASLLTVLAILVRPAIDLIGWLFVALPWLLTADKRGALKAVAIYFLVYICLMAPWWSYNYHRYGHFVRLDLGGGGVMAIENSKAWQETAHPDNAQFPPGFFERLWAPYKGLGDAYTVDEAMARDAIRYAVDNPGVFVSNSFDRFRRFFKPSFDINPSVDAVFCCILAPIYLFAAFFIFRTPPALARLAPALLVIIFLAALHSVTHSESRFRVPLDPLLALFAASGMVLAGKLTGVAKFSYLSRRSRNQKV
jgi:hypothetical protein